MSVNIIEISLAYCVAHFIIFIFWLHKGYRMEFSVLIFHIFSFIFLSLLVLTYYIYKKNNFIFIGGAIALHGIYSLSILELYSLSQGSYAISILQSLNNEPRKKSEIIEDFLLLGEKKRSSRILGLSNIFVTMSERRLSLTAMGSLSSRAIKILQFLANIKDAA